MKKNDMSYIMEGYCPNCHTNEKHKIPRGLAVNTAIIQCSYCGFVWAAGDNFTKPRNK